MSIKDVAARSGVAFQTVSKVLNGKGSVTPATRERILAAVAELGYVPDAQARSVRTRTTATIGVITIDFSNTTIAQHVVGIEREARRHNRDVIITSVDEQGSDCERSLRILRERRVDGIIVNAPAVEDREDIAELLRTGPPTVSLHHLPGDHHTLVHSDGKASALLPVRHLLGLGHRRIAMVTGWSARRISHVRHQAYVQALEEAGIDYDPALVEEGRWDVDEAYRATHRLFDRSGDITAVFAQNDQMAIGVLSALHDRGLRVPADCSVIGCDDIPIATQTIPPLTTVRVPFYEAGETAVRVLLDLLARDTSQPSTGSGQAPRDVVLPVHMVYRSSTGPVPE